MSESPNGGAPGPPAIDDAQFVRQGPTHEQEVRALAILVLFVVIFLAVVASLYLIRWLCRRMVVDRGVETKGREAVEDESSYHEGSEPLGKEELSGSAPASESAKRCHPSNETMVENAMPEKAELKKECVAIGTLRPCPQYSHVPPENEKIYVGNLSKRLKEPPKHLPTYASDIGKAIRLPETTSEDLALHTGKSPPKMLHENGNTDATPLSATSDRAAAAQNQLPTQLPQSGIQPTSASPAFVSTPGPQQSQMTSQTGPASADMMIVGQSSVKSASSADGFSADARVADTGVRITGATVSIKPMRRKGVRKTSREKRMMLPQPELPEVTTPPQTARAITPLSSKLMTSKSFRKDNED